MTLILRRPATGPLTSPFGPRAQYGFHHGIDYGWYTASPDYRVFAAAAGTVTRVWRTSTMGLIIEIDHGAGYATRYNHLAGTLVQQGQKVKAGQHIGTMGHTGSLAAGTHLHFELWHNGARIDPAPYMTATAGGGTPISTKENTMPAVIKRTEGTPEWSLVHPALVGPSDLERGYIVTSDPIRGKWWARLYDDGAGNEQGFERADYIEMQANARKDHEAWAGSSSTPGGPSAADVAAELAKLIPPAPTAEDVAAAVAALPHPTYTATPNA